MIVRGWLRFFSGDFIPFSYILIFFGAFGTSMLAFERCF